MIDLKAEIGTKEGTEKEKELERRMNGKSERKKA